MAGVIKLVESWSWVDGSGPGVAAMRTRYNIPTGNFSITNGAGRFAGNALALSGDGWFFNYYSGPFGASMVFGFAVKFQGSTTGSAGAEVFTINELGSGVGNEQVSLRFDGTGRIRIQRQGTILATGNKQLQANTYYYFEFAVHLDPAAGSAAFYVDGVLDVSVSGVNTQPQATATSASAKLNNTAAPLYCDMYGIDGGLTPLGPRRVSVKLPTADGATQQWTPSAGSAFQRVNTVPPNGDTNGFISDSTPGDASTFLFGALPYAPATVDAVQVSLYARFDDGGPHEVATQVRSGGTDFVGTSQSVAANYLDFYLQVYALNPKTAAPWTAAQVDAAEYGVNLVL